MFFFECAHYLLSFSSSFSYKVPGWHLLQGTSHGLYIPEQEDDQYGNADETGDAIEIPDAEHQKIGGIVGQAARHVVCHLITESETVKA